MTSLEELYLLAQVLKKSPDSLSKFKRTFSSAKEAFRKIHFPEPHEKNYFNHPVSSAELLEIGRNRWSMLEELVMTEKPYKKKSEILQNIRIISTIHKELTRVNQWNEQIHSTRLLSSKRQYLATGS